MQSVVQRTGGLTLLEGGMGIWRVIVPGVLVFSCVSVDLLLEIVSKRTISGHIVDNLGHGMIAFVSYAVFTLWQKPQSTWKRAWIHSFVAGICSCAMDLDHFIAAGSFRIDAATNLKVRKVCLSLLVTRFPRRNGHLRMHLLLSQLCAFLYGFRALGIQKLYASNVLLFCGLHYQVIN